MSFLKNKSKTIPHPAHETYREFVAGESASSVQDALKTIENVANFKEVFRNLYNQLYLDTEKAIADANAYLNVIGAPHSGRRHDTAKAPWNSTLDRLKLLSESKRWIPAMANEITVDGSNELRRCYYFQGNLSHQSRTRIALTAGVFDVGGTQGCLVVTRGESTDWGEIEPFVLDTISRDIRIGKYAPKQLDGKSVPKLASGEETR